MSPEEPERVGFLEFLAVVLLGTADVAGSREFLAGIILAVMYVYPGPFIFGWGVMMIWLEFVWMPLVGDD